MADILDLGTLYILDKNCKVLHIAKYLRELNAGQTNSL